MGNAMNIGFADFATTLEGQPVIIDVANNDFLRFVDSSTDRFLQFPFIPSGISMVGDLAFLDLFIRPQGPAKLDLAQAISSAFGCGSFVFEITPGTTPPRNGMFSITKNTDGVDTITYLPNPDFNGVDTFSYQFVIDAFVPEFTAGKISTDVLVTVKVGTVRVGAVSTGTPASFITIPNELSTEQAIAIVNGPFNIPALRAQSAASTANSQAVANGFFASLFNLFNRNLN
jgi:hypothetical protein